MRIVSTLLVTVVLSLLLVALAAANGTIRPTYGDMPQLAA
jgi:hypothetical protein